MNENDEKKLEDIRNKILLAIPKHIKKLKVDYDKKEREISFSIRKAKSFIGFLGILSCISFLLSWHLPDYVYILMPFPMICFIFVIPGLFSWQKNLESQLNSEQEKANPEAALQVMNFFHDVDAKKHLQTLFERPSMLIEYQESYIDLLTALGVACKWIEAKRDHLVAARENLKEILDDAYSEIPKTFEPEYLEIWRQRFESFQLELRNYFGKDLEGLWKMTSQNPIFFLKGFNQFLKSTAAKKLRIFLQEV